MEGVESKAESQGEDSQNTSENVEVIELEVSGTQGFQQCVKEIFNLIEQDENVSEIKLEIYDCKMYELTKLVTELSNMHGALADQNVDLIKDVSKNTHELTTPIKTQQVDSSSSTSPQVTGTNEVGYDFTLNTSVGGFSISTREGSESSFAISSSSESESSMPINKNLTSRVKKDASKVKETKAHDPEVLLKKISTLEKERSNLKKKLQNLTDENALLEAEKANAAELKLMISESNRKIETMGKLLEASRQQVLTVDEENSMMKKEMSNKVFGKVFNSIEKQNVIDKQGEEIKELNTQIDQLKISHAAEVDKLNTHIETLKNEVREKCEFMEDLKNLML
ncbi:hypothetical protein L1887_08855 [Cichorium endivia]|nr:hypothetical protein L1887_08855 [Cichorium endivia]